MRTSDNEEFIPTRQTLLSRLKDWTDEDSWREFFEIYWKLIYLTAKRSGLSDAEAEDVVQDTVIGVCKSIKQFDYDPQVGSFKSWLTQRIRWRIADQLRKRRADLSLDESRSTGTQLESRMETVPDPTTRDVGQIEDEEWEQNLVDAAIERVKRRVNPKDYQLFDLYVLKEWPAAKVSAALRVTRPRIYYVKHIISRLITNELKQLKTKGF